MTSENGGPVQKKRRLSEAYSADCLNSPSLAWTTPRKEEFSYKWTINDAKTLLVDVAMQVKSPPFEVSKVSPFPLYLYATFKDSENRMSIYFGHDNLNYTGDSFSVWISKCSVSIFDPQTHKLKYNIDMTEKKIIEGGKVKNASENINNLKKADLLDLIQNDALIINFTATLTSLTEFDQSTGGKSSKITEHSPSSIMKSMLGDDLFTDAVIKVGKKNFKVHRAVLASQSDVFKRMFTVDMKENKERVIEVFDINAEVMISFLNYIYTGFAPNLETLAKNLLFAADKYNVHHLAVLCEQQIQTTFTSENVAEILQIVHKLPKREDLKDACIKFIKHNTAAVYESDSWQVLRKTSKDLALEVSERIVR